MTANIYVQATEAAILAAGLRTRLASGLVDSTDGKALSPDPFALPSESELGYALETKAADIIVSFHRDLRSRTFWLWIDRDSAPLTGNYVCEVNTTVSTYDATSAAPADVDELLTEWAAQINSDISAVTATLDTIVAASGTVDAVRVVVDSSDSQAYVTCSIGASTSAPAGADLHVLREPDYASLEVYTKTGTEVANTVNRSGATDALFQGWRLARTIGELEFKGYDQRGDFAERSNVFLRLYDEVTTDETLTVVGSGAGIYGVEWVAVACVAGTVRS